jgi:hypothetical protein
MKRIIKLRDMTDKQYRDWVMSYCDGLCTKCPLRYVSCTIVSSGYWSLNRDMYSDKFLNQTVEIEVPDILTKEEYDYLAYVIKPLREEIVYITKTSQGRTMLHIIYKCDLGKKELAFPAYFYSSFNGMENAKHYTLEELGL